jgi:predicted dehydrogenase
MISWAMHMDTIGDAIILGTKGGLRIPSTECWNGEFDKPLTIYKDVAGKRVQYQIPHSAPTLNGKGLFYNKIRSFLDAIKNNGTAPIPSSQIIKNQAIIDAIVKSAELGREVEVSIPEI